MVCTVQCMDTRRRMFRLRCQREFLTSFSSKSIKFLNYRVPMEAILLTGNLITGLGWLVGWLWALTGLASKGLQIYHKS